MSAHGFAPYQDASPERVRALSPPPRSPPPQHSRVASPRASLDQQRNANRNIGNIAAGAGLPQTHPSAGNWDLPGGARYTDRDQGETGGYTAPGEGLGWRRRDEMDMFETRLGLRVDYEACLSYLLLPPAGAVLLLVLEHKSDYVRYVEGDVFEKDEG